MFSFQLRGFTWLDYVVFIVYLLASVMIGVAFVKEQRTVRDYFLAGRSMGWFVIAISVIAALFSGISYLGAPTEAYKYNLVYSMSLLSFFIATPITAVIFVPFFYNLKLYTAYEYLERRFDFSVRGFASAMFILRTIIYLALATYAPALALAEVTGFPLWMSILITGVLTTLYTTLGGMKAVIWTDVMQFFVLFAGILVTAAMAISKVPGGVDGVLQIAGDAGRLKMWDFDLSLTSRVTVLGCLIGMTFTNLVQLATDQISVQRYMTATSLKEVQKSLWFKVIVTIPIVICFYVMGTLLFAFYQSHPDLDPVKLGVLEQPDRIMPYFVVNELPHGIPGVMIAAIFAATMSTVSAGLNALTTTSLIDFYKRRLKPTAGADETLRLAKWLTVFYGVITTAAAFGVGLLGQTLIQQTNTAMGQLGGPVLGVFLLALFIRRANGRGTLIGAFAGWAFAILIWKVPLIHGEKISFMWYAAAGTIVTVLVGWVCSYFFAPPDPEQVHEYSFRRGFVVEEREEVLPEEWEEMLAEEGALAEEAPAEPEPPADDAGQPPKPPSEA